MKDNIFIGLAIVAIIIVVGVSLYGMRMFNNAVTPITVHEVEPGIKCASMVIADGVSNG